MKTSANVLKKMMAIALLSAFCLTSCQAITPPENGTEAKTGEVTTSVGEGTTNPSEELTTKPGDSATPDPGKNPGENPKPLTGLRKVLHDQLDEETTAFLKKVAEKDEKIKKILEDENNLVMETYTWDEFNGRETVSHFIKRSQGFKRSFCIFNATEVYTLTCVGDSFTWGQSPIAQHLYLKTLLQEDGEISYQGKTSPIKSIARLGEAIYVETEKENYIRLLNVPKYPAEECYAFSGDMMPLQVYRWLYGKYQEEDKLLYTPNNRIYDAFVRVYAQNLLTNLHPIATGALQLPEEGMALSELYKKLFGDLDSTLIPTAQMHNVHFFADGTRRIAVTVLATGEGENAKQIVKKVLWDRTGEQFVTDADMAKITAGTKVEDLVSAIGCPYYVSINWVYMDYCTKDETAYRVYFNQEVGKEGLVERVEKCKLWGNADKPLDVDVRELLNAQMVDAATRALLKEKLVSSKEVAAMIDRNAYILEFYPDVTYSVGDTAATLKGKIAEAVKTKRAFYVFDSNEFYQVVIENGTAKITEKGKLFEGGKWLASIVGRNGVFYEGKEEYVVKSFIALKNAVFFETDQGVLVRSLGDDGKLMDMNRDPLMKDSDKK